MNSGAQLQFVFQVVLRGPGVNRANNQALILRQADGTFRFLLRSGDPAPGVGLDRVKIARLITVDVDPTSGHYAVLGILRGAPPNANLALFSGNTTLGDDTTEAFLRLPSLVLRKGDVLDTGSSHGIVRSLFLRPAPDRTGAGGRGLGQVVGAAGRVLFTATVDRRVQEVIVAEP